MLARTIGLPVQSRASMRSAPVHAFIAGFLAVLVFHQGMFTLLHVLGVIPALPFSSRPTPPLGVPQIWSASFWGGVWGIAFLYAQRYFPRGPGYWIAALLFGAVVLSAVGWFVVAPLHGQPVGNGFAFPGLLIGPLLNGTWAVGTALLLRWHGVQGRG
jgi:hypothetical protein